MKTGRQAAILDIVSQQTIETQDQLLRALELRGFPCAQATLSRDIKTLRLVKSCGETGRYRYVLPGEPTGEENGRKIRSIARESVVSFDHAGNLVVIHTLLGLADPVCTRMEQAWGERILGAVAGNDTVFLVMESEEEAARLREELDRAVFGG